MNVSISSKGSTKADSTIAVPICFFFMIPLLLHQDRNQRAAGATSQAYGGAGTASIARLPYVFHPHFFSCRASTIFYRVQQQDAGQAINLEGARPAKPIKSRAINHRRHHD